MNQEEFKTATFDFFAEIYLLISGTLPDDITASESKIYSAPYRSGFSITTPLRAPRESKASGSLLAEYLLTVDRTGKHLAVRGSKLAVNLARGNQDVPAVRFEYDHDPRHTPASHIHVHGESVPLGILLHKNGRVGQALSQPKVHYPTGGHLYRPSLEDVIQFAIEELGFAGVDGWEQALAESRAKFHYQQAKTAIRQNHELAATVLQKLGYTVSGGPTDAIPGPHNSW